MKINSEAVELTELKEVKFDLVDGKDLHKCDDGVKKIGPHVGRMCGEAMKVLVVSLTEEDIKKPKYPTVTMQVMKLKLSGARNMINT